MCKKQIKSTDTINFIKMKITQLESDYKIAWKHDDPPSTLKKINGQIDKLQKKLLQLQTING